MQNTKLKVLKFGGTSMANASAIKKVCDIVKSDVANKFIVVSAPGKREKADIKVTDLLYEAFEQEKKTGECSKALDKVQKRFEDIIKELNLNLDLSSDFEAIKLEIKNQPSNCYIASRGEYLSAKVFASAIGYEFVDASEIIRFSTCGRFLDLTTKELARRRLKDTKGAVIGGFYGANELGTIWTFSRGGSDVTGSIIAGAMGVCVYENWTDVDGFMAADPRIVDKPDIIEMMTYKELRELSYMGASVLHSDSIFPLRKKDIPIHIRNTFNPKAVGTLIVPTKKFVAGDFKRKARTVTGIAGKKFFIAIFIEKSMMNDEIGFARRVLSCLEKHEISLEQMPAGIDTLTILFDGTFVSDEKLKLLLEDINLECSPDNLIVEKDLALIAVVGHGMSRNKGTAARVCSSLCKADINIRLLDQGSSELNIIVGIELADFEKAIKALHKEFHKN